MYDPATGFHLPIFALEEVPTPRVAADAVTPTEVGTSSSAETTRTTLTLTVVPARGLADTPLRPASSALDLFVSRRDRSLFDRLMRWLSGRPDRRVW